MIVKRAVVGWQHRLDMREGWAGVRRDAAALGDATLHGVAQGLLASNPGRDAPGTMG